jgi:hypothetical protein
VGVRFLAQVQAGSEAHPVSYKIGTGYIPGVKRSGRGVDYPPHLASKLKKSRATPLGLRVMFKIELYFYLLLAQHSFHIIFISV